MKKLIAALALCMVLSPLAAEAGTVYVNGYYRADGTYVQGHYQTTPDSTRLNNYSTQGNINPYTGQAGTVSPYATPTPYYNGTRRRSRR